MQRPGFFRRETALLAGFTKAKPLSLFVMPAATPTLSVIIPCYNEMATLPELLRRVEAAEAGPVQKEIILVDDGSTDGTRDFLESQKTKHRVLLQTQNQGKGSAIRTGLAADNGDFILVLDADLE